MTPQGLHAYLCQVLDEMVMMVTMLLVLAVVVYVIAYLLGYFSSGDDELGGGGPDTGPGDNPGPLICTYVF